MNLKDQLEENTRLKAKTLEAYNLALKANDMVITYIPITRRDTPSLPSQSSYHTQIAFLTNQVTEVEDTLEGIKTRLR